MGCKVSKVEDLPLVVICKKRKELIRAAAYHRYALAVAHISYFSSLRDVGDALHRFVDEDLLLASASAFASSPSSLSSPVLTLPSDDAKPNADSRKHRRRKPTQSNNDLSSSTTSISHSISNANLHNGNRNPYREGEAEFEDADDDSEIYFSSVQSKASSSSGKIQAKKKRQSPKKRHSPKPGITYSPTTPMMNYTHYNNPDYLYGNPYNNVYDSSAGFYPSGSSYGVYYMKKESGRIPSVIYEEPKSNPINSYVDYGNVGDFGFEFSSVPLEQSGGSNKGQQKQQRNPMAPTPPSPKVSAWEYFNPFEGFEDGGYAGYFVNGVFGYDSDKGSSDSRDVREREGIPDLEEETESDVFKDFNMEKKNKKKKKKKNVVEDFSEMHRANNRNMNVQFDEGRANGYVEGSFNGVPLEQHWQQVPKPQQPKPQNPQQMDAEKEIPPVVLKEVTNSSLSSEVSIPVSVEEVWLKGRGMNFGMDEPSQHDVESSKLSSFTALSAHGSRDLGEVVDEIKDEFEAAIEYGNEICQLLEAGKLPYQSKTTLLNVMLSRMPCPVEESVSAVQPQPRSSVTSDPGISRIQMAYVGDPGNDTESQGPSLVSTLDKLYVWEKKLYNEVKDEEKLRIMYERKCKKLKIQDYRGADSSKIQATEESIQLLSTRINMSIKTVDVIARKIHQIRDKELLPQLRELILGMKRMWRLMFKCHQKQLQAIYQSKINKLGANTGSYSDSTVRASAELEMEILKWGSRFNDWIKLQKSYVKSLNAWLLTYLTDEPVMTPDGPAPYSPGQIGAPSVFVICHDWMQAMERLSQSGAYETVQTAMNDFASILHELRETQDEEQCRRIKADHTLKDFERLHTQVNNVSSEKGRNLSVAPSDLDLAKQRVKMERAEHKEAIKLVNAVISRSIKTGFIPIFEALETFTGEAVKAFENVRLNE